MSEGKNWRRQIENDARWIIQEQAALLDDPGEPETGEDPALPDADQLGAD